MRVTPFLCACFLVSASRAAAGVINTDELNDLFDQVETPTRLRSGLLKGVNLQGKSSLFRALNGNPPPSNFEVIRTHKAGELTVLTGLLRDDAGTIIGDAVVARRASSGWALVASHSNEVESVKVQGNMTEGSDFEYSVTPRHNDSEASMEEDEVDHSSHRLFRQRVDWREGAEMDASGTVVIDVLCAVHSFAMADAGNDVDAICTAMMESLNFSLVLSGIDGVRMRVVAAMQEDPPGYIGSTSPAGDFYRAVRAHFQPKRAEFGADHVIYLTTGREGLADCPGWFAMGGVRALSVMRHEVGHNMNISHCPTSGSSYFGHLVPETGRGTIMCGNHIPLFASKDLTDFGYPAGRTTEGGDWQSSADSNAVNAWLRNAAAHSAYMPRRYPFEEEERIEILPKQSVLWHRGEGMDREISFVSPTNAKHVMVLAVASTDYPQGAPELYVQSKPEKMQGTSEVYYAAKHWLSGSNYILVKDPTPGLKYSVIINETINNTPTTGYEVRAWAFSIPYVTTTTTITLSETEESTPPMSTPNSATSTPITSTTTTTTVPTTTTSTRTKIDLDTSIALVTTPDSSAGTTATTLYYQTVLP